jgi:hypothetical protein
MKIFKNDTDVILQGPIVQSNINGMIIDTLDLASEISKAWFVNKVIVSTWVDEPIHQRHENNKKIVIVQSEKMTPHLNNMNLQLKSTKEALEHCTSKYTVKMRSDQLVYPNSFNMMKSFVEFYIDDIKIKYTNGKSPKGHVFVHGIDANNPYLPQDHIWWGYTEDIKEVFACDYLNEQILDLPPAGDPHYYDTKLNMPSWIGLNYMKKFDERIQHHFENPHEYLYIVSPKRNEALAVYAELRDEMFRPFPKLDMLLIKRFPLDGGRYPYDMYMRQNHYFYEEQVEKTECKYNPEKGYSKFF